MTLYVGLAFCVGGLIGWLSGYTHGWTLGEKDTERRWSEAVGRAHDRSGQP